MPPVKLSKISFPPPRPRPTPGAPSAPPPAPAPGDDAPTIPGVEPTLPGSGVDLPVENAPTDPTDAVGEPSARRAVPQHGDAPVDVDVPSELVDRVWRAVETVPGLTLATALTLALQQFLATLPDDYEREEG